MNRHIRQARRQGRTRRLEWLTIRHRFRRAMRGFHGKTWSGGIGTVEIGGVKVKISKWSFKPGPPVEMPGFKLFKGGEITIEGTWEPPT